MTRSDGGAAMFDRIAARYDLLNRLMSLGLDQSWRKRLVSSLSRSRPSKVLDVATGTADVAMAIAKAHPEAEITGLDPSEGMLLVGQQKVAEKGLDLRIKLMEGDAQRIPFDDDTFDACCISFGIRNVPDRMQALREMRRVTRPGGTVSVLELAEPKAGLLAPLARLHVHHIVPLLGSWLSGSSEYRYLQRSIEAFPAPDDFAAMMTEAGLRDVAYEPLGFGAAYLFVGHA